MLDFSSKHPGSNDDETARSADQAGEVPESVVVAESPVRALSVIQTRREEEKEQRRNSIIAAAEELIGRTSWAETNFSEIAKLTRLSRSLMYVYFPTKEDLFHTIGRRGAAALEGCLDEARAAEGSGLEQVEAVGRAYERFAREYPIYFALLAEEMSRADDVPVSDPRSYAHAAYGLLEAALRRGLEDGSISDEIRDPQRAALVWWAALHGVVLTAARKARGLSSSPEGEREGPDSSSDPEREGLVVQGLRLLRRMLAQA